MIEIIDSKELPEWLTYPKEYLNLIEEEKDEFLPWYLMEQKYAKIRNKGLVDRYPDRTLFVFARVDGEDDIACWEKGKPGKVVVLHDFTSPGWENRMEFDSFNDWYKYAYSLKFSEQS